MTSNRSVSEMVLKPCPFCGGAAKELYRNSGIAFNLAPRSTEVGCASCQIAFRSADKWNTRASSQAQSDDVVERETPAMKRQQAAFREKMDRKHASQPPSTEHGFNQHYFPDDIPPAGGVEEENRELRKIIAELGYCTADASLEFMALIPAEVRAALNESSAIGGGDGQ